MGSLGSDILDKPACRHADDEEKRMKNEYKVPRDPLLDAHNANNLPLIAFSYLVRRFIMCPRWCMICSRLVDSVVIRPYVCNSELCAFQYLALGLGPSAECA